MAFQPARAADETFASELSIKKTIRLFQTGPFEEHFKHARIRFGQTKLPGNHNPFEGIKERKFLPDDLELFGGGIGQSIQRKSGVSQLADETETSFDRTAQGFFPAVVKGPDQRCVLGEPRALVRHGLRKRTPAIQSFVPIPEIYFVEKIFHRARVVRNQRAIQITGVPIHQNAADVKDQRARGIRFVHFGSSDE